MPVHSRSLVRPFSSQRCAACFSWSRRTRPLLVLHLPAHEARPSLEQRLVHDLDAVAARLPSLPSTSYARQQPGVDQLRAAPPRRPARPGTPRAAPRDRRRRASPARSRGCGRSRVRCPAARHRSGPSSLRRAGPALRRRRRSPRRPPASVASVSRSRFSHRRATANASSGSAARAPSTDLDHLLHERLVLEPLAALLRWLDDRPPQAVTLSAGSGVRPRRGRPSGACSEQRIRKSSRSESTTCTSASEASRARSAAKRPWVSRGFSVNSSSNWSTTSSASPCRERHRFTAETMRSLRRSRASSLTPRSNSLIASASPASSGVRPGRGRAPGLAPGVGAHGPTRRAAPGSPQPARTTSCRLRRARSPRAAGGLQPPPKRLDLLLAPEERRAASFSVKLDRPG